MCRFSHQLIGRSVENLGSEGFFLMLFSEGYLLSVEPQALQIMGRGKIELGIAVVQREDRY